MGKYLIINADDFGLTQGVTDGIINAAKNGVVTSTTVMINELIYNKVTYKKSEISRIGIGLHLNLTQGRPILPAMDVTSLVSLDGVFQKPEKLFAHAEKIYPAQVEKEWRAQLAAFRAVFGMPDHLDSHHHVHLYPSLFNIFCQLALEMKIPMRFPVEIDNLSETKLFPYEFADGIKLHQSQWQEQRDLLDMVKLEYPVAFMDNIFYEYKDDPVTTQKILKALPEGGSEMMCHPGYADDQLKRVSSYTIRREDELKCLQSADTREYLRKAGIDLIRYSEL